MKKQTTSNISIFQDPSFIRSLCKVVGALGFSCITFFTYAPKSSKSYFVLNILKIRLFHVFPTCLKGFKLKKLVIEPKTVQPAESDEEPVDRQLNWSRSRLPPSSIGQGCEQ